MMEGVAATLLPWDSAFFGLRIARLSGARLREADLPTIETWCRSGGVNCLYFLADPSCPQTLAAAHKGGFKFVDMRWDLELSADKIADRQSQPAGVRIATEEDTDILQAMARRLHTNTRFFKDTMFPRERAAELYAEWLRLSLRESKRTVLVATTSSGRPAGYLACEAGEPAGSGRIALVGIDAPSRGLGMGTALVRAALVWFLSQGVRTVRVATQAENLAAARLYIAAGFSPAEVGAWFHRWFAETG